ncbi:MAG TPA: substrate-binding domain-containing protein [Dissulfurispiraceae bacterium]
MKTSPGSPVFFCLILLLAWGSFASPALSADYITGSGCSVSNIGYLSDLAKEYERRTGVKVFVRGGGSMIGIEDLRGNKVDFAASCRNRGADDPKDVAFIQVAWDALVFIVHKSNPVENISLDAVRAIYAGKIVNWEKLGGKHAPIRLFFSRPQMGLSGVEASTNGMVLRGKAPAKTPNAQSLVSAGIVEEMVGKTPVGFATTGFSSARKRNVKMLKVNGVFPSRKSIASGAYPFRRPLFLLVPKHPKQAVRRFVDFALSREGQQFISSIGAVSLQDVR